MSLLLFSTKIYWKSLAKIREGLKLNLKRDIAQKVLDQRPELRPLASRIEKNEFILNSKFVKTVEKIREVLEQLNDLLRLAYDIAPHLAEKGKRIDAYSVHSMPSC